MPCQSGLDNRENSNMYTLFTEAAQKFQSLRSEMQGIATKIGELETDAEEHR